MRAYLVHTPSNVAALDAVVVPETGVYRRVRRPAVLIDFLAGHYHDWGAQHDDPDDSILLATQSDWQPYVIASRDSESQSCPLVINQPELWYARLAANGLAPYGAGIEPMVDAAHCALAALNAAAKHQLMPENMARARTFLAVTLSAYCNRVIGGSIRDMEIAKYVTTQPDLPFLHDSILAGG